MNVIVIPDASMIVIPLIEKNGHAYLSPSNFSRYDNMDICEGNLAFDNLISRYSSSELPIKAKFTDITPTQNAITEINICKYVLRLKIILNKQLRSCVTAHRLHHTT